MLKVEFDFSDLNATLDEIDEAAQASVRPAAQAGAQVFYNEVRARVSHLGYRTGNLLDSIYQAFSEDNSRPGQATYHIGWNYRKAPHGRLVEYGHIQRYKTYVGTDGKWYTAVRPGVQGPKPRRRASQAEKDAYYVPLPQPKQVAAKPFLGPAYDARQAAANEAAESVMIERVKEVLE